MLPVFYPLLLGVGMVSLAILDIQCLCGQGRGTWGTWGCMEDDMVELHGLQPEWQYSGICGGTSYMAQTSNPSLAYSSLISWNVLEFNVGFSRSGKPWKMGF